jgi:RNA polymerase sigma-70 factor (ECF subfamily)
MDLHVEKQCIEKMKAGNAKQFLMLFDGYFNDLYSYVTRRVEDSFEAERIVRLTFLDALGQIQSTPEDLSYLVWLYGVARPRTWANIEKTSFPEKQGLIDKDQKLAKGAQLTILEKAEKMFKKLSLEEREILRLKFCEQVTDGEVMSVLGTEDAAIGPKIYRVLKRAHFLLFGESDERQGVYFGELSSFMGRVRSARKIEIPEALKLSLRADISQKIDQKNMAIDQQPKQPAKQKQPQKVEIKITREEPFKKPVTDPFNGSAESESDFVKPVGSNDPAKIFVKAVNEMKKDDEIKKMEEKLKAEQREALMEVFEKFRWLIFGLPIALFVVIAIYVGTKLLNFTPKIPRPLACENVQITFDDKMDIRVKSDMTKTILKDICSAFDVSTIDVSQAGETAKVLVVEDSAKLTYELAQKNGVWQITSYEKAVSRNAKPREV